MDAVEMRKRICPETLEVPDSYEAQSNAGDGEKVEQWVDELCVDSPTAGPSPNIGNNVYQKGYTYLYLFNDL